MDVFQKNLHTVVAQGILQFPVLRLSFPVSSTEPKLFT